MAVRITSAGFLAVAMIAWQFGSASPVWSQTRSPAGAWSSPPRPSPAAPPFLPQFNSLLNGPSSDRPGSGKSEPARQPAGQPAAITPAMRAALQSTVRLRVEDAQGQSVATGTIIDTHGSEALVITCGHVFRESRGQGRIQVELFTPGAGPAVAGKLLDYDLQRDIGLLCIPISTTVPVSRVGVAKQEVRAEQPVFSIGCDHGERPRVMESEIVAINQFVGPPNYTATHAPSEGRSGGGLFTADGLLIGICNAADLADDRGLFAALPTIHWQLDRVGQARIYGGANLLAATADSAVANREQPVTATDLDSAEPNRAELSAVEPTSAEQAVAEDEFAASTARGENRVAGEARMDAARALADLHREAEAIVLIRSPGDPTGRVEVVSIERLPADLRARLGRPLAEASAVARSSSGAPSYPAPNYPAQNYPGQNYPAQSYPAPSYPAQTYPG
ncbi:MAG: trypsin-like peptidase domain-containing protein, partial [Planctomycetota bacterium]